MGIFNRGENQEEPEEQVDESAEGIEAPVVTDPPDLGAPIEAVGTTEDENDAWEDPAPEHKEPPVGVEDVPQEDQIELDDERRPRGWLEADVERLIKAIESGEVAIEADAPLTPHFVAAALTKWEGLAKEPSTGAVSAVFDRWVKIGAAVMETKPYRFVAFTDEAKRVGIPAMKQYLKDQAKLDRQAKKDADTQAAKAAAVEKQQTAGEPVEEPVEAEVSA